MSNPNFYIGIDPSFVTMGAARYVPGTDELELFDGDFDEVVDWICQFDLSLAIVVVENPALNQNSFGAMKQIEDAIMRWWRAPAPKKSGLFSTMKGIIGSMLKISRDAGENMGAAKYFVRKMKRHGIPVVEIAPSKRDKALKIKRYTEGGKNKTKTIRIPVRGLTMATKTSIAQFEEITGRKFKGTKDHSRDAATLVYARSMTWGKMQLKIQTARADRDKAMNK